MYLDEKRTQFREHDEEIYTVNCEIHSIMNIISYKMLQF